MPEPIVHNPKANAIAKGVKQFSNIEKICWGKVSGLGNSPQGKVYDSMQVYLPLVVYACLLETDPICEKGYCVG